MRDGGPLGLRTVAERSAYHQSPDDHQKRRRQRGCDGVNKRSSSTTEPKNNHIAVGWCVRSATVPVPHSQHSSAMPTRHRHAGDIAMAIRTPSGTTLP